MGALCFPLKFIGEVQAHMWVIPLLVMQCCSHDKVVSARLFHDTGPFFAHLINKKLHGTVWFYIMLHSLTNSYSINR